MSLRRYADKRLVILSPSATAFEAARAMGDNGIGCVLVGEGQSLVGMVTDRDLAIRVLGAGLDPNAVRLGEIMASPITACDVETGMDELLGLMRSRQCRRVPIVEAGRPIGIVTLDDLVLDGAVRVENLRPVLEAQLGAEAPRKPEGVVHPVRAAGQPDASRARGESRAENTYFRMIHDMQRASGLPRREDAERALVVGLALILQRLMPSEASDLMAQLPSRLRPTLQNCLIGPNKAIDLAFIERTLEDDLQLERGSGAELVGALGEVLSAHVSRGEIEAVRDQLPGDMKAIFPESRPALRRIG